MRKLSKFVALSLLAHLMLITTVPYELPRRGADPPPLEARLQPTEPPPTLVMPPAAPARSKQAPRSINARKIPAASASVAQPAASETVASGGPVASHPSAEPAAAEPPPEAAPVIAERPAVDPEPAPVAARRLPRKGEITYVVYLGTDKFSVGQTLQTWELTQDTYRLTSVSETTGLVSFFRRERRAYESVGKLTVSGLRPESFANQRIRSGRSEDAKANFDWKAMMVTLGKAQEQKSVALPLDAQDLMSFMYQLGLRPLPAGRIEVPITNGWKLERYELDVGVEESLKTPFGTLRVLPVKQVRRAGQESIELWLATEYRLLPVRIQFFDRQGEPSGEQLVSDIRVSDD